MITIISIFYDKMFHKTKKQIQMKIIIHNLVKKYLIKEYLDLAGIDSENYSGHSLRSGFATTAAEAGAEERTIMAMTGHKSTEMVRRYIKDANIFKNNALNKIKI